jgi:hypothetical protein
MKKHLHGALAVLLAGCGSSSSPDLGFGIGQDSGLFADTGMASNDSGGGPVDSGGMAVDSGMTTEDSGMRMPDSGMTMADSGMPLDAGMMSGAIPDPGTGNGVDNNFGDIEPNDTPSQATPLGIAASSTVRVWVTNNSIGGSDVADYFVFKSASAAGTFSFDICYSGSVGTLTATLWTVANGQMVTPPVGTWMSSGTCVMSSGMGAALAASTTYLFGVTATGGAGMYSA